MQMKSSHQDILNLLKLLFSLNFLYVFEIL